MGDLLVLDSVDLDVNAGDAVAIFGRNGVGKSTLMRIAGGLIGPDAGMVELDGLDPFGTGASSCNAWASFHRATAAFMPASTASIATSTSGREWHW